jgi:hypothetical protein
VARTFEEVSDEQIKSMKELSVKLLDGMSPMVRDRLLAIDDVESQECPICFDAYVIFTCFIEFLFFILCQTPSRSFSPEMRARLLQGMYFWSSEYR